MASNVSISITANVGPAIAAIKKLTQTIDKLKARIGALSFNVRPVLDLTAFRAQYRLFRNVYLQDQSFLVTPHFVWPPPLTQTIVQHTHEAGQDARRAFLRGFDARGKLTRGLRGVLTSFRVLSRLMLGAIVAFAATGAAVLSGQLVGAFVATAAAATGALGVIPGLALAAGAALGVLKLATAGLGDAIKEGFSGDAEKFAKALEKIPPSARATAVAIVALKPAFDRLREAVARNFFRGLAQEITALAKTYLPLVQKQAAATATYFNAAALGIGKFLRSGYAVKAVADIFGDIRVAIGNVTSGLPNIVAGLLPLLRVSTSFLPGLTEGFGGLAERFATFMREAEKSGQLKEFISGGLQAVGELFKVFASVGSILKSVFVDATGGAGGFITVIGTALKTVADFLNTAEGESAISAVFSNLALIGQSLGSALSVILPELGNAFRALAPAIPPIAVAIEHFLKTLAPILPIVGQVVAAIAENLAPVFIELGPVLLRIGETVGALLQAAAPLLPVIGQLASIVGNVLVGVLSQLIPVIMPIVHMLAGTLLRAFAALAPVILKVAQAVAPVAGPILHALASVLDEVVLAVMPLLPIVAELFLTVFRAVAPILTPIIRMVGQLAGMLGQTLAQVLVALMPVFQAFAVHMDEMLPALQPLIDATLQLVAAFLPLVPVVAELAATMVAGLIPAMTPILKLVAELATLVIRLIATGLKVLVDYLTSALVPWIDEARKAFGWIADKVEEVTADVRRYAIALFNFLLPYVREAIGNFLAIWSRIMEIRQRFIDMAQGIIDTVAGVARTLYYVGADIMAGLARGIEYGLQWVRDKVSGLGGLIPDWLKDVLGIASPSKVMADIGNDIMRGLTKGIERQVPKVEGAISGVADAITDLSASPTVTLTARTVGQASIDPTLINGATAAGVYQITVNVPPTVDTAEVGRQIVKAIRSYEGTFGRTVLATTG